MTNKEVVSTQPGGLDQHRRLSLVCERGRGREKSNKKVEEERERRRITKIVQGGVKMEDERRDTDK